MTKFFGKILSPCHLILSPYHHGFYIDGVQIFKSNSQRTASINSDMLEEFDEDAPMEPTSPVCEESNSKAVFDTALKLDSSHTEEVGSIEAPSSSKSSSISGLMLAIRCEFDLKICTPSI